MITLTSSSGNVQYDVNEYVCDSLEDIPNLPHHCAMGSIAVIISTAEVYMKNSNGEWVKL